MMHTDAYRALRDALAVMERGHASVRRIDLPSDAFALLARETLRVEPSSHPQVLPSPTGSAALIYEDRRLLPSFARLHAENGDVELVTWESIAVER